MSDLILVTGGTGFIGSYLVRALLAEGRHVRLLVRCAESLPRDVAQRVQIARGDIRDAAAVEQAVRGAGEVLHLAALARAWTRDPREFYAINLEAVRTLCDAALRAGVRRLVHTSTLVAAPPYATARVAAFAQRLTPYEDSKIAAERVVMEFVARGLDAVIVRPTRVFGPGPLTTDANAATRLIALYLAGRFRARLADGDVQANWVLAEDVARAIALAAERGVRGGVYYAGGDNLSLRGFLDLVGDIGGVHRRMAAIPPGLAVAVGRAAEAWGALGFNAPITSGWVRIFLEDRRIDLEPTRAALGYAPRGLREALALTITWLRQTQAAA